MTRDNSNELVREEALQTVRQERRKRAMAIFFGVAALAAIVAFSYWVLIGQYHIETDDAFVAGNIMQVSAQIPGTVTEVLVDNTQQVEAGQTLIRLDSKEATTAMAQAEALLTQAIQQQRNLHAISRAYNEQIAAREAELTLMQSGLRARSNASSEVVSPEELLQAKQQVAIAKANLAAARAQSDAAQALSTNRDPADSPLVKQAAEQARLAYINYARAQIVSPIAGTIGQRSVQIGQQVGPGLPLMSVISLRQVWAEANLKEEQIRHVRVGQPVTITTDVYGPSVKYRGKILGFSAGTGSAFSLLPAQNATGNWIKVVQRIPVTIALNADDLKAHPLRLGLSLQVNIDTRDRGGSLINLNNTQALLPKNNQQRVEKEANEFVQKIIAKATSND
jgi:membrane fusion protein, multidrug efflux system